MAGSSLGRAANANTNTNTMDEYPPGSLDHSVPFLLTLGTRAPSADSADSTDSTGTSWAYDARLSAALKDQAVLIRSELAPLESDQALALLRYIQERDASQVPCNSRETAARKYRFRTRTAERVSARLRTSPGASRMLWILLDAKRTRKIYMASDIPP